MSLLPALHKLHASQMNCMGGLPVGASQAGCHAVGGARQRLWRNSGV